MLIYPGLKVHSWTIVAKLPNDRKTKSPNLVRRVRVECQCGERDSIPLYYLTRKQPPPKRHCGCLNKGLPTLHKPEYACWYMMNVRCSNENHIAYKHYGGRGIQVCERWRFGTPNAFKNFLEDLPPRPSREYTLDRVRVNEGYKPDNVRWATWDEQNNNKRSNLPPPEEITEEIDP